MDTRSLYESIHPRYPELSGQVAIVTGSSRGIGKGIATRLAREGMKVVINGRTPETVEAITAELRGLGADALAVLADVGQTEDINRLFAKTLQTFGSVDLLVNNAANIRRVHFFEVDEAFLDAQLTDNIRGPYLCAYRAAEAMRESGRGGKYHPHQFCGRVDRSLARPSLRRNQRRARWDDAIDGSGIGRVRHPSQCHCSGGYVYRAVLGWQ